MTDIVTLTPNPAIDLSTSVEQVVPRLKLRCSTQTRDPGGGGINVARVIKRLGGDVAAVYPIGGFTGQLLRELVEREQISSHTSPLAQESREDFSVTELCSGKQFRFVLPGPQVAPPEWHACLEMLAALKPPPRFLVASGSLPPGMPDDFYARVCRIAKGWNARMILDSSGPPLAAAIEEGVYLIKPNLRELGELVGTSLTDRAALEEACRSLVTSGHVELVALTMGHLGATLVSRDQILRSPPLPIQPVSTIGAGDSFLGAVVSRLASGRPHDDALRYGMAAGSAAMLTPGTKLCYAQDVAQLVPQVIVESV